MYIILIASFFFSLRFCKYQQPTLFFYFQPGLEAPPGPQPPNYYDDQIRLVPGVLRDTLPVGAEFGDVTIQPQAQVSRGESVAAE